MSGKITIVKAPYQGRDMRLDYFEEGSDERVGYMYKSYLYGELHEVEVVMSFDKWHRIFEVRNYPSFGRGAVAAAKRFVKAALELDRDDPELQSKLDELPDYGEAQW